MIGFPKQLTDFSAVFYKDKAWEKSFDKQIKLYLDSSYLTKEKKEDWKFFPFHKVLFSDFDFCSKLIEVENQKAQLKDSILIQIKNGRPLPCESRAFQLLSWEDFLEGKVKLPPAVQSKVRFSLNQERNHFSCLNNTFYPKGFLLVFKDHLKQPVEIHHTQDSFAPQQALNLRSFIFVEKSAQVLEFFYERNSRRPLFLNAQTDCFLEETAQLEYFSFDNMAEKDVVIHQMFSYLNKKSKAYFFNLSLNAGLSRWFKYVEQEEESESKIKALSLMSGKTYTDYKTSIKHQGLRGQSEQFFKSFLFDSARYIFQGLIAIEKSADESDTSQLNKNYLFSPKTSAVSLPELDIYPANVKAKHGSATSSFFENNQLLFYLKSRGIDSAESFHLALLSLLEEIFLDCPQNIRAFIKKRIEEKLPFLEKSANKG